MMKNSPGPSAVVFRLFRLIRKELYESLRDRRTVLTLILMPVLLYPLLVIAFQQVALANKVTEQQMIYRIGFVSEIEMRSLVNHWLYDPRGTPSVWDKDEETQIDFLAGRLKLTVKAYGEEFEAAVRTGRVDVGVMLQPPGGFQTNPQRLFQVDAIVLVREHSQTGRDAARHLDEITSRANVRVISEGLRLIRVPQRADAVRLGEPQKVPDETDQRNSLLPALVPLILILMTMTGAVYPAIDLTAGERERGTLEILVAAPIPRLGVLFAKYIAVLTVALLTALVNLGMMALTLWATGLGKQLFPDSFTLNVLIQVLALLVLFASFFSAVLLTLTSFARSFKEAQAYLIPLMLFCLLPGMLALMPGMSLSGPLAVVPLLNIVLLTRDLFSGQATPTVSVIVVLSTSVYAIGALALAARVFGTEAVLSNEQSGWSDLFRRPQIASERLNASTALLCLALMFPLYFLFVSGMGQQAEMPLVEKLAWTAAGTLGLFALVPAIFAWRARMRLVPGLRLAMPAWLGWPVALLLGASVWAWVPELVGLLTRLGLTSLGKDFYERSAKAIEQWQEMSPLLIVLVLGVLVPVLEELFFRGLLFSALLGERGAWRAILGSAALFAVFHICTPGGLAVERLLTSFVLGLILGTLAYASGSVWPGVLVHVLHNSIGVLAGYYKSRLVETGWLVQGQESAPMWVLAVTATTGLLGLGLLAWLWTDRERR